MTRRVKARIRVRTSIERHEGNPRERRWAGITRIRDRVRDCEDAIATSGPTRESVRKTLREWRQRVFDRL